MMCGTKVETEKICSGCGTKLDPEARFCHICGMQVSGETTPAAPVPSDTVVLNSAGYDEYSEKADLVNVVIADGVTQIEKFAFESCTNLKSIRIPYHTVITDTAFEGCDKLEIIRY